MLTVKFAVLLPCVTTTVVGTLTTDEFELESVTVTPPKGAAPLKVTVPVVETPPGTTEGDTTSDVSAIELAGTIVSPDDWLPL